MIIECNRCHKKLGTPQAFAGIYTILPAAFITGILFGVVSGLLKHFKISISVLVMIPAAIFIWFFLACFLGELPRWLTFLRYGFSRCPQCGARDWGKPYYSGFGL